MTDPTRPLTDIQGHLAKVWHQRQRISKLSFSDRHAIEKLAHDQLDFVENHLHERVVRSLAEQGLTLLTTSGPVWSWYPEGYDTREITDEDEPHRRWRRGDPLPDAARLLTCRISGWAVPPLTEEDEAHV